MARIIRVHIQEKEVEKGQIFHHLFISLFWRFPLAKKKELMSLVYLYFFYLSVKIMIFSSLYLVFFFIILFNNILVYLDEYTEKGPIVYFKFIDFI